MNPAFVGGGAATAFLCILFVVFWTTIVLPGRPLTRIPADVGPQRRAGRRVRRG